MWTNSNEHISSSTDLLNTNAVNVAYWLVSIKISQSYRDFGKPTEIQYQLNVSDYLLIPLTF